MPQKSDLLQGTLDLLILKALQLGPRHGFGISALIRRMSKEVLQVEQGSLYPALYRLEERGWIESEWGVSENNRKARFYQLTPAGRKQLVEERSNWDRLSTAVNLALRCAGSPDESATSAGNSPFDGAHSALASADAGHHLPQHLHRDPVRQKPVVFLLDHRIAFAGALLQALSIQH